jgi:hypothetical protein
MVDPTPVAASVTSDSPSLGLDKGVIAEVKSSNYTSPVVDQSGIEKESSPTVAIDSIPFTNTSRLFATRREKAFRELQVFADEG